MQPKLIQANRLSYALLVFLFLFASHLNAQPPTPVRGMVFGTMLGEVVNDVCTDPAGNSYYTGMYSATTDFDPGPGVSTLTSSSGLDLFVLKLDAAGNFVWAVSFGSPVSQVAYHVRADNNGNVYVAGWFSDSVDFDPGAGTAMRYSTGLTDAFFLKLDAAGHFVSVCTFGHPSSDDWGTVVQADANGNMYMMGIFKETVDFDPSPTATHTMTSAGNYDIFIVEVDSSNNFVWAGQIGGAGSDNNTSLDIDALGNLYIAGILGGDGDLDPGAGVYLVTGAVASNSFIAKISATHDLVWAGTLNSNANNSLTELKLDNAGHLYCVGGYNGAADFDPGPGTVTQAPSGSRDIFVLKLDTASHVIWVKSMGGSVGDASNLSIDGYGNIHLGGRFSGTVDFDPGPATAEITAPSISIFMMKLDPDGNYRYAMEIPGSWIRHFGGIAVHGTFIHVVGYFGESITFGDTTYTTPDLGADAFIFTYAQPTEGTLPLTLLDFDVRLVNNHAYLKWVTKAEENLSHYIIERSSDGRNYTAIGQQVARGHFNRNVYNYKDRDGLSGSFHYRLKYMDKDGFHKYSPVRTVTVETNRWLVKVYPIPAKNNLTINTIGVPVSAGRIVVELYNNAGVLVAIRTVQPAAVQTIDVRGVAAGSYTLRLRAKGLDQSQIVLIR